MKAEMKIIVEIPDDKWVDMNGNETDDYREAALAEFIKNVDNYIQYIDFDVVAE